MEGLINMGFAKADLFSRKQVYKKVAGTRYTVTYFWELVVETRLGREHAGPFIMPMAQKPPSLISQKEGKSLYSVLVITRDYDYYVNTEVTSEQLERVQEMFQETLLDA